MGVSWLVGGFNPPEKYESKIGSSSQLLGNIKNVPNHQPDMIERVYHCASYIWCSKVSSRWFIFENQLDSAMEIPSWNRSLYVA